MKDANFFNKAALVIIYLFNYFSNRKRNSTQANGTKQSPLVKKKRKVEIQ